MTVAFDAFSASAAGTTTRSWTHTPVGTPRAVIVFVVHDGTADDISGVTYGSASMTELTGSPNILSGGEGHVAYGYFLGSSIPTGAQTVTATTITSTGNKVGYAYTLTAAADTEVVDVDATINSTSQADPSVTLQLNSRVSFAAIAGVSGQDDVSGITPLAGWTSRHEVDAGTECGFTYSYDTVGSSDVTAGWTQAAEDAVAIAVAVSEVAAVAQAREGGGFGTVLPVKRKRKIKLAPQFLPVQKPVPAKEPEQAPVIVQLREVVDLDKLREQLGGEFGVKEAVRILKERRDAEIAELLRKKIRTDEDDFLLITLLVLAADETVRH